MTTPVSAGTALDAAMLAASRDRHRRRRRALLRETLLALPLPIVTITVPLILAWLLIPGFVLFELLLGVARRRLRPTLLRLAIFAGIVLVAMVAPEKTIDQIEVYPLPTTPITIAAFNARFPSERTLTPIWTDAPSTMIVFSRPRLSLRAFADELSATTGRHARIGTCGNGGSILSGADPMGDGVTLWE
jgi:hypothetical protein